MNRFGNNVQHDRRYVICAACQCRMKSLDTVREHFSRCEPFYAAGESRWPGLIKKTLAPFAAVQS